MKLSKVPYGLEKKVVSKHELGRYFAANSIDELILTLREGARGGYFKFEVMFSAEYLAWERAHSKVLLRSDVLQVPDPFGIMSRTSSKAPLSETEVIEVIRKLPSDMAERYLQFKLSEINPKKLRELLAAQPKAARGRAKDKDYERLEYNGLVALGSEVSYLGSPIYMGFQQQQVVRAFLKRPDSILSPDVFTGEDNPDIFARSYYKNKRKTLGQLIPAVHKLLQEAIGQPCIINEAKEGWRLRIE